MYDKQTGQVQGNNQTSAQDHCHRLSLYRVELSTGGWYVNVCMCVFCFGWFEVTRIAKLWPLIKSKWHSVHGLVLFDSFNRKARVATWPVDQRRYYPSLWLLSRCYFLWPVLKRGPTFPRRNLRTVPSRPILLFATRTRSIRNRSAWRLLPARFPLHRV